MQKTPGGGNKVFKLIEYHREKPKIGQMEQCDQDAISITLLEYHGPKLDEAQMGEQISETRRKTFGRYHRLRNIR